MRKHNKINILILVAGLLIILLQVSLSVFPEGFEGTDDKSVEMIKSISPDYEPWANNIWEPGNEWGEILIFALQAALGVGMILFYVIKQKNRSKVS